MELRQEPTQRSGKPVGMLSFNSPNTGRLPITIATHAGCKHQNSNRGILFQLKPALFSVMHPSSVCMSVGRCCRGDKYTNDRHLLFSIFTWCLWGAISISTISRVQLGLCYRRTLISGLPRTQALLWQMSRRLRSVIPPHSCIFSPDFPSSAVNMMEKLGYR